MQKTNPAKVTVAVDPSWLHWVDSYVEHHPEVDRNDVFNEALKLWCAKQQDLAMEAQYAPGGDPPEEEMEAWRAIMRASAERLLFSEPAQQQRAAMEAQFQEGDAPVEERAAWGSIRGAAAARFGRR